MIIARQSTARTVTVGPILDADGVAVTDAAVGDLKISKNGAAPAALNGSATLTHRNTGHYSLALTTSDLDTVGSGEIVIDDTTNAMPVKTITVVEEAVYDALYASGATGELAVDAVKFSGSSTAADNAETVFDTDFATNYSTANDKWQTEADVLTIEGSDATDQIRDAVVDDATRIDASALNTATTAIGSDGSGLTESGGTGDQFTAIPWNSSWDSEVQSECADALTAYNAVATTDLPSNFGSLVISGSGAVDSLVQGYLDDELTETTPGNISTNHSTWWDNADDTTDVKLDDIESLATASALATVDNVVDGIQTDLSNGTDGLGAIKTAVDGISAGNSPSLLQSTTIATLASQTSFTLTAGSADDDAYNGAIAVITDQSTSTQKAVATVSDYTGSTKTVALGGDPGIFTMATGDSISIIAPLGSAGSAPTAAAIRAEIDSNSTQLAAIVADTNELQTNQGDWATATGFSTLDAAGVRTAVGLSSANLDTQIAALPTAAENRAEMDSNSTQLSAIVTDTNELQTDWTNGGRLDLLLDGMPAAVRSEIDSSSGLLLGIASVVSTIDTDVNAIDQVVDAIKAVTDNLPNSGALTDIASSLSTITGADGVTLATTQANYAPAKAGDAMALTSGERTTLSGVIHTTAMTESYGTDGSDLTLAQVCYLILGNVSEFAISGTTKTVKQLDGATTAATYTLDDADNPTSITRAT